MFKASIIGTIFSASLACAALAQPTTTPATQPVAADQSTPRGALKLLIISTTEGDEAAMRSVLVAANPLEQRLLDSLIAQQKATARFQSAATAALGPAAARRLIGDVRGDRLNAIEELNSAPEHITGDTATVGDDDQEHLKKQNGKWVVTMESTIPAACGASGTDAASINESIAGMNIRAKIFSETADELSKGIYRTPAQVQRALESKAAAAPSGSGPAR